MAKYITSIERIGRVEGKRGALERLLTRRFGPLPPGVAGRIEQAKGEQLERWLDRLLDAHTPEDVFDPDSLPDYRIRATDREQRYTPRRPKNGSMAGYITGIERPAFKQARQEGSAEDFLKAHQEGFQKGFVEGFRQGRTEGIRDGLRRQLTRRFGPVSPAVGARLTHATFEQLEWWAEQMVDARTLDDVFGPN